VSLTGVVQLWSSQVLVLAISGFELGQSFSRCNSFCDALCKAGEFLGQGMYSFFGGKMCHFVLGNNPEASLAPIITALSNNFSSSNSL
jgi:hypothetical protein